MKARTSLKTSGDAALDVSVMTRKTLSIGTNRTPHAAAPRACRFPIPEQETGSGS